MHGVAVAVVAGVVGTLAMDALNLLFARMGVVAQIDVPAIGRMVAGWTRGRFRYEHPSEMAPITGERLRGTVAHYAIGIALAMPYVLGWDLLVGGRAPAAWAPLYGVATTAASWFLVFPSLGLGAFGRRSPDGLRAPLTSLANHLFYGLGLALGLVVA